MCVTTGPPIRGDPISHSQAHIPLKPLPPALDPFPEAPTIVWKGKPNGRVHQEVQKNRVARVAQTVQVNAKTDERTMLYIVKNALPQLPAKDKGLYPVDGAPSHMHASVPLAMKKHRYQEYTSPPGVTPWAQACDKTEINKNFGRHRHRFRFRCRFFQ